MVHGGPGFSHNTLKVLSPLAANRFIILYDQLGCGRSDRPSNKKLWSLDRYVTELNDIVSYFKLEQYHVLGHSFGGSIVLEHGLKHPEGLQSIILSSALVSVKDWLEDTAIRKKELPDNVQLAIEQHEADNSIDCDEYKEAIEEFNRRFLCRLDPKPLDYKNSMASFNMDIYNFMWGSSEFNCSGNLSSYDRSSELDKLSVPVLLLCGDQDEVLESTLKRYLEILPRGSCLHVFQNSSHSTYLEATDDFISEVSRFLAYVEDNNKKQCHKNVGEEISAA